MVDKEITTSCRGPAPGRAHPYPDLKSLWDRWDQIQQEEHPTQLARGVNLVGVGLIIIGAVFQNFGPGLLGDAAPLMVVAGAVILAVKKIKALRLQRSVDR